MMRFPIVNLLSEQESYDCLLKTLHPEGLHCPHGHSLPEQQAPHMCDREPIVDYRCLECRAVFNVFTATLWSGTHFQCREIILILRGFSQGIPTLQLAEELGRSYSNLLNIRHKIQDAAFMGQNTEPLTDAVNEGDEMFQNAGEKGDPHTDPDDPPRRRANKKRGTGTYENDRPPVQGVVGRESGEIRLTVCDNTRQTTIQPEIEVKTNEGTTLHTDESHAYNKVEQSWRMHGTVCHSRREYARDDDGDGIREVHCNTMEGIWTGLRNFLRPFRGIHKDYLPQYVAMFEWAHNLKCITEDFLRILMTPPSISLQT